MSHALAADTVPRAQASGGRRGLLQDVGKRCLGLTIGFAVLTPIVLAMFSLAMGETVHAGFLVYEFAACTVIGGAALTSAATADRLLRHRFGTLGRTSLAVLAAAVLGTALLQLVDVLVANPLGLEQHMAREGKAFASAAQHVAFQFSGALRWSILLVVLFELLEADHRAQDELHEVRMAAVAAERELVEGELRAMQARVDPDLLFDTLVEVDRAYAADRSGGQDRLDALIRFLRAALPGGGNGGSSVEREQELVEAYVGLVRQRDKREMMLELAVDPAVRRAPMPAMLLLPLVRWALGGRAAHGLRFAVREVAGKLSAVIESDSRAAPVPEHDEIASVRARLQLLYSAGADLEVSVAEGTRRASLSLPLRALAASA